MEELGSSSDAIAVAKKHIYSQNYQEAVRILYEQIECLQQVIEQDGTNIESYNLLAYAMKNDLEHTSDGFQKAIDIMQKALEIQPNNTLTLFNLASTYYEMEDFIQAISYYTTLIQQNKVNDYRVFYNLAMSYEKQGETSAALEHYQQSIKLNPNFSSSTINYSNLLMQLGKQTQAKYVLENYLKNNKGDMRALNNLNILLAEKQIDQKVEDNFKKINQSGAITSVYNNGVFLSKQGKLQEALTIFKGLTDRLQEDLEEPLLLLSHVNQGVLYEKMGEYDTAIAKYHFILGLFGDQINSDEFYQRIGELKHKTKDKSRFIPQINKPNMNQTAQQWNRVNKQNNVSKQNNFMGKTPDTEKKKLIPITQKSVERKNNAYQMREQQKGPSINNSQTSQFDEHQSSIEQISMVQPAPGEFHKQSTLGTNSQKSNKVAARNPRSGKMSPKRIRDASLHEEYEKQFPYVDDKKHELSTPSRRSSAEQVLDQLSIKQRTENSNYRKIKPQTPNQVLVNQQQLQLIDQDPSIQSQVVQSTQKQFMRQSLEQQQMQPIVKAPAAPRQENKEQKFFKNEEQNKNRYEVEQKPSNQKQSEQHQQQTKDVTQSQTMRQQAPILTQEPLSQRPDSGTYRKLNLKPQTPKMQIVQVNSPVEQPPQIKPQLSQEQNKFIQEQQKALKDPQKVIKQQQPISSQQSQEIQQQTEKDANQQSQNIVQQQISPIIITQQPQSQRQQEAILQNTNHEAQVKETAPQKERVVQPIKDEQKSTIVQEQQKQSKEQLVSQTNQGSVNKVNEQVISESLPQQSSHIPEIQQILNENQEVEKQQIQKRISEQKAQPEEVKQYIEPTSIHLKEENQSLKQIKHEEPIPEQTQQKNQQKEVDKSAFSDQRKIEQMNEEQELKKLIVQALSEQAKQLPNPMGDFDSEKKIAIGAQSVPDQDNASQDPQSQSQLSPKQQRKSESRLDLLELPRPISSASKRKESIKEMKIQNDDVSEKQKSSSRSIRRPDPMRASQKQQNDSSRTERYLQKQGSIPKGNNQDSQQIPTRVEITSTRVEIPQVNSPVAVLKVEDVPKKQDSEIHIDPNKSNISEQQDQQSLNKNQISQISSKQDQSEKSLKSQPEQGLAAAEQQISVKQESSQVTPPQIQAVESQTQPLEQSKDKQQEAIVKQPSMSQEGQVLQKKHRNSEKDANIKQAATEIHPVSKVNQVPSHLAVAEIHPVTKAHQVPDKQIIQESGIKVDTQRSQQNSDKSNSIVAESHKSNSKLKSQTSNQPAQLSQEQLNNHPVQNNQQEDQPKDDKHPPSNDVSQPELKINQSQKLAQQPVAVNQPVIEAQSIQKSTEQVQQSNKLNTVENNLQQSQHSTKQIQEVKDEPIVQTKVTPINQHPIQQNEEQPQTVTQQNKEELLKQEVDQQQKENPVDIQAKNEQVIDQKAIVPNQVQNKDHNNQSQEQHFHSVDIQHQDHSNQSEKQIIHDEQKIMLPNAVQNQDHSNQSEKQITHEEQQLLLPNQVQNQDHSDKQITHAEQQPIMHTEVQEQDQHKKSQKQIVHQGSVNNEQEPIIEQPTEPNLHQAEQKIEKQLEKQKSIQQVDKEIVEQQQVKEEVNQLQYNDESQNQLQVQDYNIKQQEPNIEEVGKVQEKQDTQPLSKVQEQQQQQQEMLQEQKAEQNQEELVKDDKDDNQNLNKSLPEENIGVNQPQDDNNNQEVKEIDQQQAQVLNVIAQPMIEENQEDQKVQEPNLEQVPVEPVLVQEQDNADLVHKQPSSKDVLVENPKQSKQDQEPVIVEQQDKMEQQLKVQVEEQAEVPKLEEPIEVEQNPIDDNQVVQQVPIPEQAEIQQENQQQEQEKPDDNQLKSEQQNNIEENQLQSQVDSQQAPVQVELENKENPLEPQVDNEQDVVPQGEVQKADELKEVEVKDPSNDQQDDQNPQQDKQIPIIVQEDKQPNEVKEEKVEDKQVVESEAALVNQEQNIEADKQPIVEQQNDSQAQDSASLINDNSKAELKPEDQIKNDQPLDLELDNHSQEKIEFQPNQELIPNPEDQLTDPIKGLSKIPIQAQQSNEDPQQDEINELAEVLIVPDGPKQQLQNQGSLDSNNFSSILNKGDTQNLDGESKNKKQPIKVIKYPEDFETWTEEICKQLLEDDPNNIFAVFKLALIYIDRGQVKEAKERLIRVNEIDALFEIEKVNWALGEVYEQENEWSKSLQSFRVLYPYTTEKYNCLLKIGRCYRKLDEYDRAEKTYKRAIDISNKDYQAYYKLAQMQIESGNLKDGVDNLVKAQSLNTDNIEMIIKLSEAYMMYDEDSSAIDDAIAMLHKGMLLDPLNFDCTQTLAKAYEQKGDLVSAINFAKKATEQPNSVLDSYFYLGTLYMKKKDLKSAADSFRTLLKQNSEHVQALIEYGTIASIQGNYEKAKKYLKHALQFDSKNTVANLRLGRIYQTKFKDMIPQAIECFMRVVRADPTSFKSHFYIGQCYLEKKDFIKANEQMNQALKINPKFGLAHKALANLYYEKNQPAKALKYFQKAIECESSDLEAKIGLANCYYLQEQFEQAIELYEEISRQDQNEELEYNLANCYYMKSQYDECVEHYLRALKLNPNKTECYYNLGNTYCIQEKFEEALQCFEQTIKNDPKHSAAIYNYANTYFVLQDYDSAAKYFEQAIELEPNNIEWKNYVANLYMEKGDLSAAKYHLDESLKLNSTNADTYVRYASYYYQIGNYKDTIKMAKIALSHDETNAEALALIKELTK